jgi:hypothetical protein
VSNKHEIPQQEAVAENAQTKLILGSISVILVFQKYIGSQLHFSKDSTAFNCYLYLPCNAKIAIKGIHKSKSGNCTG